MPFDPFALIVAAAFISCREPVRGLRHPADAVTFVQALLVYALVTAVESVLAARFAMVMVPDRAGGWMYGTVRGG
jgi:hypothetical protein